MTKLAPGIGFAMGMERVLLALEKQNLLPEFDESIDAYVVCPKQENFALASKPPSSCVATALRLNTTLTAT